jgi:NhaP-type Na+/H+ or K+/H+ antiporter
VYFEIPLELSTAEIMVMCSLLCSSDVIAAVSMISAKEKPKLFSTVFGEGIMNDAVSIILFNVVVNFAKSGNKFTAGSSGIILAHFIYLLIASVLVGLLFGGLSALMFKTFRSLT